MAELRFTILGCGSSGGVPRLGNLWGDCDPDDPRNTRRRCSMLVERETQDGITRVLIDTSPDLRAQLLDAGSARSMPWSTRIRMPITCTGSTICG